ncbi:ThiJ/PfpI family protein [Methanosarcina horonobensis HB-1 = JCM 15518]|uniref:ThiJ/PfpI family protein n=1 Tax=Methanosarcina horonobensis HB-1 = JCM 15518 TaxID=1434110 RepID=A0A0E3WVV2_9EURY|nr:DJ-1/PfpI family protein [Methanosarcina horonobensis]AKB78525.1 ThiJ/PfpI family protein [Methanosarcina horonobensis HB-1 = JCM 15518]
MTELESEGKKILLVIAQEQFRDEECFIPKKLFEATGAKVTVATESAKTAKGTLGGTIKPDIRISEVRIDDYDAIVISGGPGSRKYLWDNQHLRELVKEADSLKKVVSAICISPVVLARAGILKGKESTVFNSPDTVHELEEHGAVYQNRDVVVSGRVVTGRDPKSAEAFGKAVLKALKKA